MCDGSAMFRMACGVSVAVNRMMVRRAMNAMMSGAIMRGIGTVMGMCSSKVAAHMTP
jgi:hypothetical protein